MKDNTLFQKSSDLYEQTDVGMYYCGKRIDTPNHIYGPEIRNYYLFVLVNKGEATLFHRNGNMTLRTHDLFVMCPGERIHYTAHTPWSIQWVGLYGQTVDRYMKSLSVDGNNPILHLEQYYEIEKTLEELYQASGEKFEFERCAQISLIYKFLSLLLQSSQGKANANVAQRTKKMIDFNYGREISIHEIAQSLHFDTAYLSREFVRKYKISPKEYLLSKRIEHAKELLRKTDAQIKEIAASVGYSDQLYFSRLFKKRVGLSPSAYKEKRFE